MPVAAAIDLGSNALRVAIGSLEIHSDSSVARNLTILASDRELLRLGADVFALGKIKEESFARTAAALKRFSQLAETHRAEVLRAVATSAIREANNRLEFQKYLHNETGILIDIIDGREEARLLHLAVSSVMPLAKKTAVLFDIGGGSTEVSLSRNARITVSESFRIGAVRLLEVVPIAAGVALLEHPAVQELTKPLATKITQFATDHAIDLCIGTGGNVDTIADLNVSHFGARSNDEISLPALEQILRTVSEITPEERVKRFALKPDRAQVLIPALVLSCIVLRSCKDAFISVPHVGLKDGVLLDLLEP